MDIQCVHASRFLSPSVSFGNEQQQLGLALADWCGGRRYGVTVNEDNPCYSWNSSGSEEWKRDQKGVLEACLQGHRWGMAVLYLNAPGVKKGKFSGDSLAHVGSGDIDSVIRRDHPEMSAIAEVIKKVRRSDE